VPAGHVAPTVHEQLVPLQQFGPHPYGPLLSPCCKTTNGEHPVGEHEPQPQLPAQDWTPEQFVTPELQLWVVPGAHEPWPPHAPKPDQVHAELQDSDWDPQLPHACDCVAPAAHAPCPPQAPNAPQVHDELQVWLCDPQLPHACDCVAPGEHAPWLVQAPKVPQLQVDAQVRVWVPQLPHAWLLVAPGWQAPWPQAP
jgi:hypothetical protein